MALICVEGGDNMLKLRSKLKSHPSKRERRESRVRGVNRNKVLTLLPYYGTCSENKQHQLQPDSSQEADPHNYFLL